MEPLEPSPTIPSPGSFPGGNEGPTDSTGPSRREQVLVAVAVEASLAAIAFCLAWAAGFSPLVGWDGSWSAVLQGLAGTMPLLAVMGLAEAFPIGPLRHAKELGDQFVRPFVARLTLFDIVLFSVLAGVCEELFFRGFLQNFLAYWLPTWAAWLLTAVAFGLAHPVSRAYVVLAGLIGLYFTVLYACLGNLLVVMIAHGVYDLIVMLYIRWTNPPRGGST